MATKTVVATEVIIQVDKALESLRSSNFDTPAAVGEPVDNAIQAGANNILIRLVEGERKSAKSKRRHPS